MPNDLKLTENCDLEIANGDFIISESTAQHQKILILADKSELKEVPMRGVGSKRYLEDSAPDRLAREVRQEFSIDGMTVNDIKIDENLKINIEAFYPE
jgi:hypothetical protein